MSQDEHHPHSGILQELFSIEGKTALVTGGSSGIGLMIARAFVRAGARVYISSRKKEACDTVAAELSAGGSCIPLPADLSTDEGRTKLVEEIREREGTLQILVNNAGAVWAAPLEEYPEAGFDKVMTLNVKAPFMLVRDLLPLLEKAGTAADPARVINIGSIDGIRVPEVENYAYAAGKAAVHQMTRVLAVRLGPRRITVNAIAPGPFESRMTRVLLQRHRAEIEAACPRGRIGQPMDIAGAAIYLASPAGAYLNGVVLPVDGGLCLV